MTYRGTGWNPRKLAYLSHEEWEGLFPVNVEDDGSFVFILHDINHFVPGATNTVYAEQGDVGRVTVTEECPELPTPPPKHPQVTLPEFPGSCDPTQGVTNTGTAQRDGAILVVTAVDGPQPDTRRAVSVARQLGVSYILVYITKAEMVDDPELLELVEYETRNLLSEYGFTDDDVSVVIGSASCPVDAGFYAFPGSGGETTTPGGETTTPGGETTTPGGGRGGEGESGGDSGSGVIPPVGDVVSGLLAGQLPDTGGGWAILLIAGAVLIALGWLLVRLARRFAAR